MDVVGAVGIADTAVVIHDCIVTAVAAESVVMRKKATVLPYRSYTVLNKYLLVNCLIVKIRTKPFYIKGHTDFHSCETIGPDLQNGTAKC